ncbi:MAG: hypothetical protein LBV55_01310 [Acholeplasmatales bacterium]|jgi:hypothetical protein|nr:hypothetical protein [Acholeplasmatales bacterium]
MSIIKNLTNLFNIFSSLLLSILLIVLLCFHFDERSNILGVRTYISENALVESNVKSHALVYVDIKLKNNLRAGDLIAYKSTDKSTLGIQTIKAINQNLVVISDDSQINSTQILGKVVKVNNQWAQYLAIVSSPRGFIFLLILPLLAIYGLINVTAYLIIPIIIKKRHHRRIKFVLN